MLGGEPFPDSGHGNRGGESSTAEVLLPGQRNNFNRFGDTGAYRDTPFAVVFIIQLLSVAIIALANGLSVVRSAHGPSGDPGHHVLRSRQMLWMLFVAAFVASGLATCWVLLLRSGARTLIWAGAVGGTVLALANGVWLLVQGGAAGIVLGTLSLISGLGCILFIAFNRQRIEFSAHLLSTVATLTRAYPGMVWVAVGAAGVLLAFMLVWSAALSYTSQLPAQGTVVFLLLLSLMWTAQLLKAVVNATVAGTVASWYFLSPNVPRDPTSRALRRALTTSFGSLCLGSLVAASLKSMRAAARGVSQRVSHVGVRSCALCCLGFLDVLTRFFNELAYTQIAVYGKSFTRASRDTWTLLVHHSGVDALVQRELISTALTLSAVLSGLVCSLVCGLWARAVLGPDEPQWWHSFVASFLIGFGSVSLVSVTVESGTNALFVCYAEDPSPLATASPELYSLFIQHPHVHSSAKDDDAESGQPLREYRGPDGPSFPPPPGASLPPPPPRVDMSASAELPPAPPPPKDTMANALGI